MLLFQPWMSSAKILLNLSKCNIFTLLLFAMIPYRVSQKSTDDRTKLCTV